MDLLNACYLMKLENNKYTNIMILYNIMIRSFIPQLLEFKRLCLYTSRYVIGTLQAVAPF